MIDKIVDVIDQMCCKYIEIVIEQSTDQVGGYQGANICVNMGPVMMKLGEAMDREIVGGNVPISETMLYGWEQAKAEAIHWMRGKTRMHRRQTFWMQVIRESYRAVDCDGRSQQLKPCNVELAMIVHDFMVLAQHKNLPRIRFVDVTTRTCIDTVEGNSRVPHRYMVASMDEEEYV